MAETACGYLTEDNLMWVSTDERRMITRMMKLAEQYPDEVQIRNRPEDNDGCLCMTVPASWLLIRHPKKMNFSEEQKDAMRERLQKMRESKTEDTEEDEE